MATLNEFESVRNFVAFGLRRSDIVACFRGTYPFNAVATHTLQRTSLRPPTPPAKPRNKPPARRALPPAKRAKRRREARDKAN